MRRNVAARRDGQRSVLLCGLAVRANAEGKMAYRWAKVLLEVDDDERGHGAGSRLGFRDKSSQMVRLDVT